MTTDKPCPTCGHHADDHMNGRCIGNRNLCDCKGSGIAPAQEKPNICTTPGCGGTRTQNDKPGCCDQCIGESIGVTPPSQSESLEGLTVKEAREVSPRYNITELLGALMHNAENGTMEQAGGLNGYIEEVLALIASETEKAFAAGWRGAMNQINPPEGKEGEYGSPKENA